MTPSSLVSSSTAARRSSTSRTAGVPHGREGAGGDAAFDLLQGGGDVHQQLDGDVSGGVGNGARERNSFRIPTDGHGACGAGGTPRTATAAAN